MMKYAEAKTVRYTETFHDKLDRITKAYQYGIITREEYADAVNALASTIKCTYNRVYGKE